MEPPFHEATRFLVYFHRFGRPDVQWAMLVRADDPFAAMSEVHRRFGEDKVCSVVRFR